MLKKQLITAIGLSGLIACGSANAQAFNLSELIQLGAALPQIGDIASTDDLNASSGTITLNDGTTLTVRTSDGRSLRDALQSRNATLLANGNQVKLGTSANSLESAYDNSNQTATFNITTLVDSRPVTLEWEGSLDEIQTNNTFNAQLNGQPVSFELPEGTTLADFDGNTQFRLRDADGNILIDGSLNSISASQISDIAAKLGILSADMALRSAQKQAMAQNFGIISSHINAAMHPHTTSEYGYGAGLNAWVATEVSDISGQTAGNDYDGDAKSAMVGVDRRMGNLLGGVTAGYNKVDIDSKGTGNARADLRGNFLAPYGAIALLGGDLVFDGILLYQELDGSFSNSFISVDLDGHRLGARAAGTYYLPRFGNGNMLAGLTAGGAYMKDDLDGSTLGSNEDYGIELGEAFVGAKLSTMFATGRLYGNVMYYEDVTTDVDNSADVLDNDDDNRTEIQVGASHRLGQNMDFNLTARTTLGSTDTEYSAVQATMTYQF